MKFSFPHAQLWYEEMITKYPAAHFDKKTFMQARYGAPKEQTIWSMAFSNIYVPQGDLIYLEAAYKKKIDGEQLNDEEMKALETMEWLLLHEAGHIELNYSFNAVALIIGGVATLEIIKMIYKESTDDACKKSIQSMLDQYSINDAAKDSFVNSAMWMRYTAMTYAELLVYSYGLIFWIRDQEAQADNFANQHAASAALPGAISFFQRFIDYYQPSVDVLTNEFEQDAMLVSLVPYFNTTVADFTRQLFYFANDFLHPSLDYRIQTIQDEIAYRLENQIVA